ncbi:HD-GYP domain-containing protein, partial [Streptomyces sp. NPDC004288]
TAGALDAPAALGRGPDVADLPHALLPAGAAALAFCLVLTALDGGIRATAGGLSPRTAWRGLLGRSLAPHAVHGLAGLMMAVLWRSTYGPVAALFVLLPMYISCWVFAQYHRERAAHQATIRALVQAVDLKDRYTRGHSERVGHASVLIARELGMTGDRLDVVRFAGILHDVGKLGVPTRVLRKDGPLTPEERRIIELHPEYGHEMVRGIGFLGEARSAILHHHERMDGSGYPYGLHGAEIPECARVVAVADAFDAMTSTRSYSRARPVPTALAELERCAGTHFDPRMVTALVQALDRHGWQPAVTADEPAGAAAPRSEQVPPPREPRSAPDREHA